MVFADRPDCKQKVTEVCVSNIRSRSGPRCRARGGVCNIGGHRFLWVIPQVVVAVQGTASVEVELVLDRGLWRGPGFVLSLLGRDVAWWSQGAISITSAVIRDLFFRGQTRYVILFHLSDLTCLLIFKIMNGKWKIPTRMRRRSAMKMALVESIKLLSQLTQL